MAAHISDVDLTPPLLAPVFRRPLSSRKQPDFSLRRVAASPAGGAATNPSQFDLLGNAQRVIRLNAKIANGAF
jgi:hypothetical protein